MNKFFVREDPVKKDDKSSELNKREMVFRECAVKQKGVSLLII